MKKRWYNEVNIQPVLGIILLDIGYALFLMEITEWLGFNLLRVLFSLISFFIFNLIIHTLIRNRWILSAGCGLLVIVLWANLLHFRYFGSTLPLGSIFNIGFLPYMDTQILVLTRWADLLLLPIMLALPWFFRHKLIDKRSMSLRRLPLLGVIYLGLVIFQFFAETQAIFLRQNKYNLEEPRLTIYKKLRLGSENHAGSMLQFGVLWTYISDGIRLFNYSGKLEPVPPQHLIIPDEIQLKNIIAIQVEGLDKTIIGHHSNNREITPFLNSLKKRAIFFENIYAQHSPSGGTSDGDFCLLSGLYPLGYKGSLGAEGLRHIPSLPRILKDNGYATCAFHANTGGLYYRRKGMKALGIDSLYFRKELPTLDPDTWHAMKDGEFFNTVLNILNSAPEPFFAFAITLSSHSPFDLLDETESLETFDAKIPLVNNYFSSIHYVDKVLMQFINRVQEDFPNTVLLIYGDHTSNIHTSDYSATFHPHLQPVPLFLLDLTSSRGNVVLTPGSSVDFAPTLLDYLNYPQPTFWHGKSLLHLEEKAGIVLLSGSNYYVEPSGKIKNIVEHPVDRSPLKVTQRFLR